MLFWGCERTKVRFGVQLVLQLFASSSNIWKTQLVSCNSCALLLFGKIAHGVCHFSSLLLYICFLHNFLRIFLAKAVSDFLHAVYQLLSRGRRSDLTWSGTSVAAGEACKEKQKCFDEVFLYHTCLYSSGYWDKCLLILIQKARCRGVVMQVFMGGGERKKRKGGENTEEVCKNLNINGLI